MYKLIYSTSAQKDAKKIAGSNLKIKCQKLLDIIAKNPHQNPPPSEKLVGDLHGCLSRRINIQHHLVYEIFEKEKTIVVLRMWSHYE
jgi:toxin YoeB